MNKVSRLLVPLVVVILVCSSVAPMQAFAGGADTPQGSKERLSQTLGEPSWDPDDPASWTEDESPFYPEAKVNMTVDELLEFVANIEANSNTGAPSGATDVSDDSMGELSLQSISLQSTNKLISAGCRYYGMRFIMGGRYAYQGGFDCTGFVIQCLYDAFGLDIDRAYTTADVLYNRDCTPVAAAGAKPGDLVFWRGTYGLDPNWISHVGIYCGGDITFVASGTTDTICFQRIDSVRHINGGNAPYFFATPKAIDQGDVSADYVETVTNEDGITTTRPRLWMYRLYNPHSGEHLFTRSIKERDDISVIGWVYEGTAWEEPDEGDDVYRMYNPNSGDHHYTLSAEERDDLVEIGWNYEGVGWLSNGETPVYRLFNPNETIGTHHYTTSKAEYDSLVKIGWSPEGIAWYAN